MPSLLSVVTAALVFASGVIMVSAQNGTTPFAAKDFVYNFNEVPNTAKGEGGTTKSFTVREVPALKDNGIAQILFTLEPGAINSPHIHPRATEALHLLEGELRLCFVEENMGGGAFCNEIKPGTTAIFPKAHIHYQQNIGLTPVKFLSTFNDENPGTATIHLTMFRLPDDALSGSFKLRKQTIERIREGLPLNPVPQGPDPMDDTLVIPETKF